MSLTNHQQEIFDKILESFGNVKYSRKRIVLSGYAGTGKTYLVSKIVEHLGWRINTMIAAPTHKATQVINEKCKHLDAEAITMAAMLNLQPDYNIADFDPEDPVFKTAKEKKATWGDFDFIIIDESSMIPSGLLNEILKIPRAILFVGDPAQLPPVKEDSSPVFDLPEIYTLQEVIRTNKNDILELSMLLRSDNYKDIFGYQSTPNVEVVNINEFNLKVDKYLAYRNVKVTEANKRIKEQFNPSDLKIAVGDNVMFYQPIYADKSLVFSNSEEAIVSKRLFVDENYDSVEFQGSIGTYQIVKEPAFEGYIRKHRQYVEAKNWKSYYFMRYNYFLDQDLNYNKVFKGTNKVVGKTLDLCYAMTVHKSQGSTYGSVAIELEDLKNRQDAQALLYTAVTRASDKVYLLV